MKTLAFLLLCTLPLAASSHELLRVKDVKLATVLGLLEQLATTPPTSDQPHIVRIYAVPDFVGECGGVVSTCPDVRLFIAVSNGDLGEVPALYQLPRQKGWEFVGWSPPTKGGQVQESSFVVRSALPESNIDPASRAAWRPTEYHVRVSPSAASYVQR
jgi:hypothetical protein